MKRRVVALTLAVIMAAGAGLFVWLYVGSVRSQIAKDEQKVTVLVARESIPALTLGEAAVENNLVEAVQMPSKYASADSLSSEVQLKGRVVKTAITKGQQIVAPLLTTPEAQGLSFEIPTRMRAISIPVSRANAVGGNIRPGDRVDVIVTFDYDVLNQGNVGLGEVLTAEERERIQREFGVDVGASKGTITRAILQQVKVMSIDPVDRQSAAAVATSDDEDDKDPPNSPVAVLMVSLADAERLVFAQSEGQLTFALVPAEDQDPQITPGHSIINAFRPQDAPQNPPAVTPVTEVSQ